MIAYWETGVHQKLKHSIVAKLPVGVLIFLKKIPQFTPSQYLSEGGRLLVVLMFSLMLSAQLTRRFIWDSESMEFL